MPRIHYRSYKGITLLARDLRRNMTSSEKDLWAILRKRSFMGFKFLRQHPVFYRVDNEWIEFFVADFYCAELKLIVELDGGIHESKKEYDKERDEKLLSKGIIVIRFRNEELNNTVNFKNNLNEIIYYRINYLSLNKWSSPLP